MTEYVFKLPVEPVAQMRPRFTRRPYVHAYDPVKVKRYKQALADHAKQSFASQAGYFVAAPPVTGPIKLQLRFFRPIQKSVSKVEHARRLSGAHRPIVKPDLDNYIKSTLDALTGVLWADDNAIIKIEAEKYYSDQPRVEIVMEVEDDDE